MSNVQHPRREEPPVPDGPNEPRSELLRESSSHPALQSVGSVPLTKALLWRSWEIAAAPPCPRHELLRPARHHTQRPPQHCSYDAEHSRSSEHARRNFHRGSLSDGGVPCPHHDLS